MNQDKALFRKKPYKKTKQKDGTFNIKTDGLYIRPEEDYENNTVALSYSFKTKYDDYDIVWGNVLHKKLFKKCIAGDKELSRFFLRAKRENKVVLGYPFSSSFCYNNVRVEFGAPDKELTVVVSRDDDKPLSPSLSNPAWIIRLKHYLEKGEKS